MILAEIGVFEGVARALAGGLVVVLTVAAPRPGESTMNPRLGLALHGAARAVAWSTAAAATGWSFVASINVGVISTAGVAVIGILAFAVERATTVTVKWMRERAAAELAARKELAAADLEIRRSAAAADLEARKASDAYYAGSFGKQVDDLKAQITESEEAAVAERTTLLQRVNDANQKLHDERVRWNATQIVHAEEAARLQDQLREANGEMRLLRGELRKVRGDYAELWEQYEQLRRGQEAIPRKVAEQLNQSGDDLAAVAPGGPPDA